MPFYASLSPHLNQCACYFGKFFRQQQKGGKAIKAMKCNVTHALLMPSLACGNVFASLESRHSPFGIYDDRVSQGINQLYKCMNHIKKNSPSPTADRFKHLKSRFCQPSIFPIRSLLYGELGPAVKSILFGAHQCIK